MYDTCITLYAVSYTVIWKERSALSGIYKIRGIVT